jgi:hypothetical protein
MYNPESTIVADHRLPTKFGKIDDTQAFMTETDITFNKEPFVIRTTMV